MVVGGSGEPYQEGLDSESVNSSRAEADLLPDLVYINFGDSQ